MGKATVVAKAARACKQQEQGQNYATINHGQVKPTTGKHDKKSYNMAITKNSQQATTSTRTNGKQRRQGNCNRESSSTCNDDHSTGGGMNNDNNGCEANGATRSPAWEACHASNKNKDNTMLGAGPHRGVENYCCCTTPCERKGQDNPTLP